MADRPRLRSVGGCGPDPPSVLFQQLSAAYPGLPRRVVAEVLSQVYGAAWDSTPEPIDLPQLDTAARALLDAIRMRTQDTARGTARAGLPRVGRNRSPADEDSPTASSAPDLREALDPTRAMGSHTRAELLARALEARAPEPGLAPGMHLLCEAAVEHLGVTAAAVSVAGDLLSAQTVGVAGALARPLEDLQVLLGEGPSQHGLRHGSAVFIDDLTTPQHQARWPLYAPVATEHGVRAQFVFPMQVGAARFGVLVLYRERAGRLWPTVSGDARVFAEVALSWLIDEVATASPADFAGARARLHFFDDGTEIHQATGMVSVQLDVNLSTALLRLRARAFVEDRALAELSAAVVARDVRFQPGPDVRNARQEETT